MKVYEVNSVPESCTELQIDLSIPTLYDNGSNGAAHTQALDGGVVLYTLRNRGISVQTVSGVEQKDFTRRKLKIRTSQDFIRNYDSIVVGSIGKEESMVKEYIETIVNLYKQGILSFKSK